jgi:hypothetical protein
MLDDGFRADFGGSMTNSGRRLGPTISLGEFRPHNKCVEASI